MAVISWVVWAAAIVFLFASARQNWRSGYRRPLVRISLLAEGLAWLEQIKVSLDERDSSVERGELQEGSDFGATKPDTTVEQLARLGLALDVNPAASVGVSSQAEDRALVDESAELAAVQRR